MVVVLLPGLGDEGVIIHGSISIGEEQGRGNLMTTTRSTGLTLILAIYAASRVGQPVTWT